MAQIRANGPYIWVPWLPKLLSGLNSCEWASWFKAQHYSDSWARMPSDFDLSKWLTAHTALLHESRVTRERKVCSVLTEGQNHFNLRGNSAVLAGKPDLVARKGDQVKVIDAKTGRPSPADAIQVVLYMYALPRALERYRALRLTGQVAYSDHVVDTPATAVDEAFARNMAQLITTTDNPVSIRDAGEACPQPRRVPVLRDYTSRLPRASRGKSFGGRRNRRLPENSRPRGVATNGTFDPHSAQDQGHEEHGRPLHPG